MVYDGVPLSCRLDGEQFWSVEQAEPATGLPQAEPATGLPIVVRRPVLQETCSPIEWMESFTDEGRSGGSSGSASACFKDLRHSLLNEMIRDQRLLAARRRSMGFPIQSCLNSEISYLGMVYLSSQKVCLLSPCTSRCERLSRCSVHFTCR